MKQRRDKEQREAASSAKACVECGSAIPLLAKKCKECDSYQDFRRYTALSSTVLGLLVALVSVLSLGLPPVIRLLSSKMHESDIYAAVVETTSRTEMAFFVSNVGSGPGAVRNVHVWKDGLDSTMLILMPVGGSPVLGPNEAKVVVFKLPGIGGSVPIYSTSDAAQRWRYRMEAIKTNAKADVPTGSFPAVEFSDLQ